MVRSPPATNVVFARTGGGQAGLRFTHKGAPGTIRLREQGCMCSGRAPGVPGRVGVARCGLRRAGAGRCNPGRNRVNRGRAAPPPPRAAPRHHGGLRPATTEGCAPPPRSGTSGRGRRRTSRYGGAEQPGSLCCVPRLSEVITALENLWPAERAESWDAVGTVVGDPGQEVSRVLFAVDPVQEIVDEAVKLGADLLVTHHPLYLRGTTTVAASTFKGRVVHTLIKNDIALHVAHTNADTADPGVSDALAGALDLRVVGPLVPDPTDPEGRRGLGRV